MGSSSSSVVNQKYDTTIVNQSDISVLNESINKSTTESVVKAAASCSASMDLAQYINIEDIQTEGDFNYGGSDQSQTSALTFSCVQEAAYQNNIANNMKDAYVNAISTGFTTEAEDKLNASAESAAKNEFAGLSGGSHSSSSTNTEYNFTQDNITNKNIRNVVEHVISNNLNISDVQKCAASVNNSQSVNITHVNAKAGVNIGVLNQTQAATLFSECIQKSNNSNNVTSELATALGVQIHEENNVKKVTSISDKTASKSTNVGLFQSVGQGVGDAAKGIGAAIGSIFGGMFGSPIIFIIICCVICVLLIGGYMVFSGGSGNQFAAVDNYDDDDNDLDGGGYRNMYKY